MRSPNTRELLLCTTASKQLSLLFNSVALGMQPLDIYSSGAGHLLSDTSDAALSGKQACATCGGVGRWWASQADRTRGILTSCDKCGGMGYISPAS